MKLLPLLELFETGCGASAAKQALHTQSQSGESPRHSVVTDTGFTLTEVLVAMMLSMIFLSITMQLFVAAAFFRARSTQYNYAYNWMQEDFEEVLNKANQYEMAVTPYSTHCNATNASDGLAASFLNDTVSGLGGSSVSLGTRNLGGLSYTMTRTGSYTSTRDPQKLIQVSYTVRPTGGGEVVAELDTEVLIYAGFKCPT
jgi:prepilin-type N-terminal cleavage/methylation domain-containing protein